MEYSYIAYNIIISVSIRRMKIIMKNTSVGMWRQVAL